jgi:DNA-binding FrmR family transcriptional regulator
MVEAEVYCIDVPTQVSAATKALQAFSLELFDPQLAQSVLDAAGGPEGEAKLTETSGAIAGLVRRRTTMIASA